MPYSDKWRQARKLMQFQFNENRVEKEHVKLIEAEATQMLYDFMEEPEKLNLHPKRFSNSIIMSLIYGIRTENTEVEHMRDLYEVMEKWSVIMETGATPPVDLIPFLNYLPEWMLGNWKSRAREVSRGMNALYARLVDRVLKRRAKSENRGCLLDYVLDLEPDTKLGRHELNFFGGTIMEGGSDTTSSMILAFIHAMLKYPEVQRKAQQELNDVLDESRSPNWSDYVRLPYVAQVVKETMRWRPVTPLGVPHMTNAGKCSYHVTGSVY
jgi:cytochrome P450